MELHSLQVFSSGLLVPDTSLLTSLDIPSFLQNTKYNLRKMFLSTWVNYGKWPSMFWWIRYESYVLYWIPTDALMTDCSWNSRRNVELRPLEPSQFRLEHPRVTRPCHVPGTRVRLHDVSWLLVLLRTQVQLDVTVKCTFAFRFLDSFITVEFTNTSTRFTTNGHLPLLLQLCILIL